MNKPCTLLLSALMAHFLLAPTASAAADKAELKSRMEAAQKVLGDRSYHDRWSPEASLKTARDAKAANDEGELVQKRIDAAFNDMKAWCQTRFLVNACIQDARDLHHEREMEIRSVRFRADEIIRLDRLNDLKERREKEKRDPRQLMNLSGGTSAADVEAMQSRAEERRAREEENVRAYEEKQRKAAQGAAEHRNPLKMKSRPKDASKPVESHVGRTAADVEAKQAEAAERRAQEAANLEAYEVKQAEARKRLEEAESTAAKNKAKREARRANLNKTLEERRAAQDRYEESQKNRDSGLSKYF